MNSSGKPSFWPRTLVQWGTIGSAAFLLLAGFMGTSVKLLGLDTIDARIAADQAIIEKHAVDMARIRTIEMTTWCILWDVDPVVCRDAYSEQATRFE